MKLKHLVTTADGSHTIFVPELNEHYHSVHGAVQESEHIFMRYGFDTCKADPVHIFEVGFGTGLNAFLSALRSVNNGRRVFYTAVEKYPLEQELAHLLNYSNLAGEEGDRLFKMIHSSPWNIPVNITSGFTLMKLEADITTFRPAGTYQLIYFDAFGPDKQPEMWTNVIFGTIAGITAKDGILVTYSAKGQVKRNLKACGFEVSLLPGPPGKRQFIRAVKK